MSSSLYRTLKNVWTNGLKRLGRQIAMMNDTKRGVLVGEDRFGNKYYETDAPEEIHLRTRWVEYREFWSFDMSQVEPGWHFWLGYGTDVPPSKLPDVAGPGDLHAKSIRAYPEVEKYWNLTATKSAYIPYSTSKPRHETWEAKVAERA